jgi:hypothetical protein
MYSLVLTQMFLGLISSLQTSEIRLGLFTNPVRQIESWSCTVSRNVMNSQFPLTRIWGVYNHKLYDLTDYTLGLNQNSSTVAFLIFFQFSGNAPVKTLRSRSTMSGSELHAHRDFGY